MPASDATRDRPLILLVEDDLHLRRLLVTELTDEGYEVIEAAKSSEAFDYVLHSLLYANAVERPALVISDIRLREGDGLGIAEALRVADYDVPTLLMTAFPSPDLEARVEELPGCTLLAKPFDLFEFLSTVRALLGRARSPLVDYGLKEKGPF